MEPQANPIAAVQQAKTVEEVRAAYSNGLQNMLTELNAAVDEACSRLGLAEPAPEPVPIIRHWKYYPRFTADDVRKAIVAEMHQEEAREKGIAPEVRALWGSESYDPQYWTRTENEEVRARLLLNYWRGAVALERADLVESRAFRIGRRKERDAARAELTDLDSPAVVVAAGDIHHHEAQCFVGLRYKDGYRERAREVAALRAEDVSQEEDAADAT